MNNHKTLQSKGYKLRPFTIEDATEVVNIMNDYSEKVLGYKDVTLDEMLNDWTSPGIDLKTTTRVLLNETGRIIGYCDTWDPQAPHVIKHCWVSILPELWDDDIALEMLACVETIAWERIRLAPEGSRVIIAYGVTHEDEPIHRLVESSGFDLVRNFNRMVINMDTQPTRPYLMGITIRPMDYPQEFEKAVKVNNEGFQDHWGFVEHPEEEELVLWKHMITNDPDFDPSLWFVAIKDNEIIGICFCWPRRVDEPDLGWVGKLAVLRPWRGCGVGMALLQHAFFTLYQRGLRKVGLVVDSSSLTNASHLYEKAGMKAVRQYDTYHKEIRPGKDLTMQEVELMEKKNVCFTNN